MKVLTIYFRIKINQLTSTNEQTPTSIIISILPPSPSPFHTHLSQYMISISSSILLLSESILLFFLVFVTTMITVIATATRMSASNINNHLPPFF